MIMTPEYAREMLALDKDACTDAKLGMRLSAIEQTIRAYTRNSFQSRHARTYASVKGGAVECESGVFKVGDTVEIGRAYLNSGMYTVAETYKEGFGVKELLYADEEDVLIARVDYPADVVAAALDMLAWELDFREKTGVKSETLSRHSVTYSELGSSGADMGYPIVLLGRLKPYRRAQR